MVSGTLVLTDSIDKAFNFIYTDVRQGSDAVISGKSAIGDTQTGQQGTFAPTIDGSLLAKVRALPDVQDAEGSVSGEAQLIDQKGKAIVFGALAAASVNVDTIVQTSAEIVFSAPGEDKGDATAALDPALQATAIGQICDAAIAAGFRAAGTHSVDVTEDAVANTNGVAAYAPATVAYLRTLVLGDHGGSGYADDLSHRASDLDPAGIAGRAIDKCALDRDRVQLAPGDYEAVFEEDAVAEILRIMSITGLSGQSVREGRSFLSDAIGSAVTGSRFTLHDDALQVGQLAIPFDPEGTPKRRVTLVERGIATGPVHDRWSAKAAGTASTGHAADPKRYGHGGHAGNLVMAGGTATREELIGSVTRGILITRFHYTNTPDPKRATMTGTTRDGTFLIEDGRITRALANVRYTMSALDLFAGIDLLGPQRCVRDWWSTNGMGTVVCLAPAMKVSRATITGSSPT